ncbi:MAG: cell wall hydrolase, partial [Bacteroidetes bacterium]|nr:cell wall hydrolase [Bacteroidota bacterium]
MKKLDKLLLGFGWTILFLYLILAAGKAYASQEDSYDRYCMAQNIYFEAANQSFAGKLAVAHVVMNRVEDLQFPNEICGVIYQAKTRINWQGNEVPIRN